MKYIAIIPARYASTRFPAKPLAMLGGKPIVLHVCERAATVFSDVCVATDDERIARVVEEGGFRAVITSPNHRSGTDRCREAYEKIGGDQDVVVNIQGDEPFIAASQLTTVKECFDSEDVQIATLVKPFSKDAGWEALENPNSPKVVIDENNYALYFSRSVIPYLRGIPQEEWLFRHIFYKHIGLYAYRADVLRKLTDLPQGELEKAESLEQLRWLQAGFRIKVGLTDVETIGIDTPEDLHRATLFLESQNGNNQ